MRSILILALFLLTSAVNAEDPPLFQYIKSVKLDQMIADCGTILLDLGVKEGAEKPLLKSQEDWLKAQAGPADNQKVIDEISAYNRKEAPPRVVLYGVTLLAPRTTILRYSIMYAAGPIVVSITTYEHDKLGPKIGRVTVTKDPDQIIALNKDCQMISLVQTMSIRRKVEGGQPPSP